MQFFTWLKAHEEIFAALGLLSIFLFLVSLIVFPLIIIYLPHDYFVRSEQGIASLNPFRMVLRVLKNAFGCFLILAGVLMLFLPGQGLLSIFLGVSLVHFPGKRRFEMR
ncbi:MAG TPA: PGPGW domain-containing protein, partial [Opitutales bacterium]|nr:PGPGW domain-containing protein [Opitutales bacterium]